MKLLSQEKEQTKRQVIFILLYYFNFDSPCTTKVALFFFTEVPDQDGDYKNDHCRRNESHQKTSHVDRSGA